MQADSVKEAVLLQEIAELRRENAELRMRSKDYAVATDFLKPLPEPEDLVVACPPPTVLNLVATWSCKPDLRGGWVARARGRTKDGEFHFSQYVSDAMLYESIDVLQMLGALHKDVIMQFAAACRKLSEKK